MVSDTPSASLASCLELTVALTTMPCCTTVLRPLSAYSALYVPGGRRGTRYSPFASVVAVRLPCNEGPVTVPMIAPVFAVVCANPKLGINRPTTARDSNVNRENFVMYCPPIEMALRVAKRNAAPPRREETKGTGTRYFAFDRKGCPILPKAELKVNEEFNARRTGLLSTHVAACDRECWWRLCAACAPDRGCNVTLVNM